MAYTTTRLIRRDDRARAFYIRIINVQIYDPAGYATECADIRQGTTATWRVL